MVSKFPNLLRKGRSFHGPALSSHSRILLFDHLAVGRYRSFPLPFLRHIFGLFVIIWTRKSPSRCCSSGKPLAISESSRIEDSNFRARVERRLLENQLDNGDDIELNEIFPGEVMLHRMARRPVVFVGKHLHPFFVHQVAMFEVL